MIGDIHPKYNVKKNTSNLNIDSKLFTNISFTNDSRGHLFVIK